MSTETLDTHTAYETIIGLEVHAQLLTESKAFAPVSNRFGAPPNTNVTPLCLGHPGTLPVPNENLIAFAVRLGLATNCRIALRSIFARKNYFYPDMPKGYQISQFETPICEGGHVDIELEDGTSRRIGLTRIHMEEDAGKSIHDQHPHNTLIDLNRAGTPLLEIVSEPDIRSPQEAGAYMRKIWQLVRYLGICDGNMEEGSLRCDANVSIRPKGQTSYNTRTEIKNLNSFRHVERALAYEVQRQIEIVETGGQVIQQTRLWDPTSLTTRQMRTKEEAHDYRYFPEPDIPPVVVSDQMLSEIRASMPELPDQRRKRYIETYSLSPFDATVLTEDRAMADYFEQVLSHLTGKTEGVDGNGATYAKPVANLLITEVRRILNERTLPFADFPVPPDRLAGLITLRQGDKISSSAMQTLLDAMLDSEKTAEALAAEKNLLQVSDSGFLEPIVEQVLRDHPDEVQRYLSGKHGLIGFFTGQVMKQSRGKANPGMVRQLIEEKIGQIS